jgi:hypothetical protein
MLTMLGAVPLHIPYAFFALYLVVWSFSLFLIKHRMKAAKVDSCSSDPRLSNGSVSGRHLSVVSGRPSVEMRLSSEI